METVDLTIVGAGVIGLAIAARVAPKVDNLLIIEAASQIGAGISARSSEVIHAGIYYPEDWLKTRLCVQGARLLYAHCERFGIPHRRCGKLIVACTDDQTEKLNALHSQGLANGIDELTYLDKTGLAEFPELSGTAALFSPSTGIIDSHQYMLSLLGIAEDAGANLALNTRLQSATPTGNGFDICTRSGHDDYTLHTRFLINAAGLGAQQFATNITGMPDNLIPQLYLCKGCYFSCNQTMGCPHLVYPLPDQTGLGIHATLDLAGNLRFGPDSEYIDAVDYQIQQHRSENFYQSVRRYFPALKKSSLQPAYSGIRPRIQAPGEPPEDFVIQNQNEHGLTGLIQLFGIESPGLTASLAIADFVLNDLETLYGTL